MNKVVQNRKKVMLFDLSNLIMRCLFAYPVKPHEKEFKEFKAIFMRSFLKTIKDNCPEKIICCMDNTSWRKDVSESYKENRKAFRAKSIVDFDVFFPISNKLIEALKDFSKEKKLTSKPTENRDKEVKISSKNLLSAMLTGIRNLKTNYGSSTKGLLNVIEPELRKI